MHQCPNIIDFAGSQDAKRNARKVRRRTTYELGQRPVYFTHVVADLEHYDW